MTQALPEAQVKARSRGQAYLVLGSAAMMALYGVSGMLLYWLTQSGV